MARELEREFAGVALLHQEFIKKETVLGYLFGRVSTEKLRIFIAQSQQAGWFQTHNGHSLLNVKRKTGDIPCGIFFGLAQHSLGNHRPAATLLFHQQHPVSGSLQQGRGRDRHVRRIEVIEGVVEQDDPAF